MGGEAHGHRSKVASQAGGKQRLLMDAAFAAVTYTARRGKVRQVVGQGWLQGPETCKCGAGGAGLSVAYWMPQADIKLAVAAANERLRGPAATGTASAHTLTASCVEA